MWNLKYGTGESTYKTGTDSQTWRTHLWLPRGRGDGGKDWETGICRYKLVYRGWINKVLLYRTWKYIWYPVVTALFKLDNQQGPTVQHRELCSMLCGSLDGRGDWGRMDTLYIWLLCWHKLLTGYTHKVSKITTFRKYYQAIVMIKLKH